MQYLPEYGKRREAYVIDGKQGGIPNLHYGKMKRICMLKPSQLAKEYGLKEFTTKNGKRFWFKDNGAKVLGVFHSDTVKVFRHFRPVSFAEDTKIFCQTLDDRLGGYVLLEYLKTAKLHFDILMTADEERMASTGLYFGPPKDYNWMFMFDRAGTGAVVYNYGDEQLRYKLGKHGFAVERGSYSCIADMEHVGCKGINFGVGYHDNHGEYAFAYRKQLYSQLRKFISFFNEFHNTRMPHEKEYTKYVNRYWRHYQDNKDELQEKHSVDVGPKIKDIKNECNCEICMTGVSCKDFPDSNWKIKPSEDVEAEKRNKPAKTIFTTDENGKITGVIGDRNGYLLYESINILSIGSDIKNILRNTFGIKNVYQLCSTSPYQLLKGGYIGAPDLDSISLSLNDLGYDIPWNLAGYKHPDAWELERAFGYRRRKASIIGPKLPKEKQKKKTFVPVMGVMVDKELLKDAASKQPPKTLDNKTILMYPTADYNLPVMIAKAKELESQGYKIHFYTKCRKCEANFEWNFRETNKAPESCASCAADNNQYSLFTMAEAADHLPQEAGILGLVQLRKDPYDGSEFKFIGKEEGRKGVDKYGWIEPIRKFEEIGFTIV